MSFIFNIFSRFQQIESRWGYSGTSDKIRFIVDRRIFVVGFGLYGSIHGPSEYDVTIQLLHTGSGRQLGSNEISFSSDGTNSTFRAMFKESTLYCQENKITLTRNLVIALKFKKEKKPQLYTILILSVFCIVQEAVEIQPSTNYTAVATLKGLDSHYGTKGLRKVKHMTFNMTLTFLPAENDQTMRDL